MDKRIARLVGGWFILTGALVTIAGLIWLTRTGLFVLRAAKAPGSVIEMQRSESSDGGTLYRPVFAFSDAGGIIHTHVASMASSTFTFEPGEKVTILYDPSAPKRSKIDSFHTVWLGPLFVFGIGFLSGSFACVWLALAIRGIARQQQREADTSASGISCSD